jgi:hypothetical protein
LLSPIGSPELQISATGADIGDWVIAQASGGKYSLEVGEVARLSEHMHDALFDQLDGVLKVKDWIRNDIRWTVVDALDPKLSDLLGSADLLLANNFLGAISDEKAEQCMENLLRLVSPGGYFVFNGDLDLKSRFAKKHCLVPVCGRIEAVHFGDTGRLGWPWSYWASEPIDKGRSDREMRYAVGFAGPFRHVEGHPEVDTHVAARAGR